MVVGARGGLGFEVKGLWCGGWSSGCQVQNDISFRSSVEFLSGSD